MYLEMKVFGFAIDTIATRPVVILKDNEDKTTIPLWLDMAEALSMAAELVVWDSTGRTGRKDLMALMMAETQIGIGSIVIQGIREGFFTAQVRFVQNGTEFQVDVPPSEAIMAALKYRMPLLVAEDVVEQASVMGVSGEAVTRENDTRRFTEFLERLDPAVLGKYAM